MSLKQGDQNKKIKERKKNKKMEIFENFFKTCVRVCKQSSESNHTEYVLERKCVLI